MKRDVYIWKETYVYEKRPIYITRDLCIWNNETCNATFYMERHLYIWKETYVYGTTLYEKRPGGKKKSETRH